MMHTQMIMRYLSYEGAVTLPIDAYFADSIKITKALNTYKVQISTSGLIEKNALKCHILQTHHGSVLAFVIK